MPVTKTAKRALRGSRVKEGINKLIISKLEFAVRSAKKSKSEKDVRTATSLADRATKKRVIHKNKAARIKSQMAKLLVKKKEKKEIKLKSSKTPKKKS